MNDTDKTKALEEIKNNLDIPRKNNLYNKFMKILIKKERQFENEKRQKQKEAIKEIEEGNNADNNLLYSLIKPKDENDESDIVNINEKSEVNKNGNNENDNKWTQKKGYLETEEIY